MPVCILLQTRNRTPSELPWVFRIVCIELKHQTWRFRMYFVEFEVFENYFHGHLPNAPLCKHQTYKVHIICAQMLVRGNGDDVFLGNLCIFFLFLIVFHFLRKEAEFVSITYSLYTPEHQHTWLNKQNIHILYI